MVRAIFVRHGQSTGNAGIPCNNLSLLELTELGRKTVTPGRHLHSRNDQRTVSA